MSATPTGWEVQAKVGNGAWSASQTFTGPDLRNVTLDGKKAGVPYGDNTVTYRMRAVYAGGVVSAWSNEVSYRTPQGPPLTKALLWSGWDSITVELDYVNNRPDYPITPHINWWVDGDEGNVQTFKMTENAREVTFKPGTTEMIWVQPVLVNAGWPQGRASNANPVQVLNRDPKTLPIASSHMYYCYSQLWLTFRENETVTVNSQVMTKAYGVAAGGGGKVSVGGGGTPVNGTSCNSPAAGKPLGVMVGSAGEGLDGGSISVSGTSPTVYLAGGKAGSADGPGQGSDITELATLHPMFMAPDEGYWKQDVSGLGSAGSQSFRPGQGGGLVAGKTAGGQGVICFAYSLPIIKDTPPVITEVTQDSATDETIAFTYEGE